MIENSNFVALQEDLCIPPGPSNQYEITGALNTESNLNCEPSKEHLSFLNLICLVMGHDPPKIPLYLSVVDFWGQVFITFIYIKK